MRARTAALTMIVFASMLAFDAPAQAPAANAVVSGESRNWSSLKYTYTSPTSGDNGMPVGNGRFGAKLNGGVAQEVYNLNHKDWWSGDPKLFNDGQVGAVPGVAPTTPASRAAAYATTRARLIAAYQEGISAADRAALMKQADRDAVGMWGTVEAAADYLPLGKLQLDVANTSGYTSYSRTVDIDSATTTVTYKVGSTIVTRETFVSYPDNVMAIRTYTNDGTAVAMTVTLALPTELAQAKLPNGQPVAGNAVTVDAARNEVAMTARAPWLKQTTATWASDRGITAEARVKVQTANGQGITPTATGIQVSSSDSTLLFSAKTSYVDPFTDPSGPTAANPATWVRAVVDSAAAKSWASLKARHVSDWQAQFRTLWIELGGSPLYRGTQAIQPMIYARHYQYARYIMLSTSRSGTNDRPHNQQSMWSLLWNPISDSSHFLNENVQKMYGLIETANLANSGDPLWKWIRNLAINGAETASGSFGMTDGSWTTPHNSDVWAQSEIRGAVSRSSVSSNEWAIWNSGGIWLMNNLYDSYEYSQDIQFLKSNYDLIEGATKFALNQLGTVPGVHGELKPYLSIIGPSTSPENRFSVDGTFVAVDINVTADVELYNNLFEIVQKASAELQAAGYTVDTTLVDRARDAQSKLVPLDKFIDPSTGALKEWYNEYPSKDYKHRHSSHLLAWYPLNFTKVRDESAAVTAAARAAYLQRGTSGGHPDRASMGIRLGYTTSALTYPPHGLVDAVNAGYPQYGPIGAFVGEALIDSRDDVIRILPFAPTEWSSGNVDGLRARGGFEVSIRWAGGVVDRVQIKSSTGATPVVEIGGQRVDPLTDPRVQLIGGDAVPQVTVVSPADGTFNTIDTAVALRVQVTDDETVDCSRVVLNAKGAVQPATFVPFGGGVCQASVVPTAATSLGDASNHRWEFDVSYRDPGLSQLTSQARPEAQLFLLPSLVEAENFSSTGRVPNAPAGPNTPGVLTKPSEDGGSGYRHVSDVNPEDWWAYSSMSFAGASSVTVRAAVNIPSGSLEFRAGSPTGTLLATVPLTGTGSWTTFREFTAPITATSTASGIYVVAKVPTSYTGVFASINWMRFTTLPRVIEAETFGSTGRLAGAPAATTFAGVLTKPSEDAGQGYRHVSDVNPSDWWAYPSVDLRGVSTVTVRAAVVTASTIEIRRGSSTGTLLGTISLTPSGGWSQFKEYRSTTLASTVGVDQLVFVIAASSDQAVVASVNWLRLE